jgi:glycosyltransferase involved in cell wall biosynthesis
MEADIGVSTHLNHLETRYAFRTRMLDYLWASLPILCTKGDSFAALIEKEKAGVVVTFECEEAIKRGILEIVDHPEKMKGMEESSSKIAQDFTWSQVTKPLLGMIEHLSVAETFDKCHKNWISTLLFMKNPFRLIKSRKAIRHMQAAK